MTSRSEPLVMELRFRKDAAKVRGGKLIPDTELAASLPDVPPQFKEMRGSYAEVSKRAAQLNEAQLRSGFLHYLFWPETVSARETKGAR